MKTNIVNLSIITAASVLLMASCKKDNMPVLKTGTITVENVLNAKPLVESGTFKGTGTPPVILPGQSVSFSFSAAKNQRLTFATMYGWSNDLFFAPANPGIKLYNDDGTPITGDVSSAMKIWDNGTRKNQVPGKAVTHPGTAESPMKNIKEVNGTDDYGNKYLAASKLMKVSLAYNGNSMFTVTIMNISGGSTNETPFSPGVWAISYVAGGNLLLPEPIYSMGKPTANGLTNIAEAGDNAVLSAYISANTGIFTPLSPVLVVVYHDIPGYHGNDGLFFALGEKDRGQGLKDLAQKGNADVLAAYLATKTGVRNVYVLKAPSTTVLLPNIFDSKGGKVTQQLSLAEGDKIAIATMYGFSNDWFFASHGDDIPAKQKGDVSSYIGLYDDGTAVNQFPGAGITQFNLAGTPLEESKAIDEVPNPNMFTTLPAINNIIKVTLQ
ncbi:MAG: spondin domain-containing protein [Agriterribacter sp.]